MKTTWIALLAGGVLMHSFAFADVSYQETTQYTGGSMMGMLKMAGAFSSQAKQATSPVTSTVMIHGGRMLRSNPHTTEIIDLDAQDYFHRSRQAHLLPGHFQGNTGSDGEGSCQV